MIIIFFFISIIAFLVKENSSSDDDSKCYDFSSNCKECKGTKSESHSTSCKDGYSLDGDICVGLFSIKGEYTSTYEHIDS